jgi:hypothetical protein
MAKKDKVVIQYDNVESITVSEFLKAVLKEMLIADTDTLKMQAEVENPDSSLTTIEFDIIITKLSNDKASK